MPELQKILLALTENGDWVVSNLQAKVQNNFDLPPFTMWFKPESAVEIVSGDLVVLCAFEMGVVRQLFAKKGFGIAWKRQQNDLFPIELSSEYLRAQTAFDYNTVNIGDWQRLRVMYSFLAVESFVEICSFLLSPEAVEQAQSKTHQDSKRGSDVPIA